MSERARYGVDAPGVVRGLLGGGIGGLVVGAVLKSRSKVAWFDATGSIVSLGALVPLGLGLSMVAYAAGGKLRLRNALLARHTWRGDEIVLDIGAGRGLMAIGAAKLLPRGRVIALDLWSQIDLSGNGPDALKENAAIEGVADRIEIVTGDARKLDMAEASVDVVLSVLCIHNIEPEADRRAALMEIARVLKPGGTAIIADYILTKSYARAFLEADLGVVGPRRMESIARTLMAVIEATKPDRTKAPA